MTSQQPGSELGGLTPNLRRMSVMDSSALTSMPSERCHKPPQMPPTGRAGLLAQGSLISYPSSVGRVLTDILHCLAIRLVERPPRNPSRIANRSKRDIGSRLVVRGESPRNLSNSSAIVGFPRSGGCHFRGFGGSFFATLESPKGRRLPIY